jgi:hypothetical protein
VASEVGRGNDETRREFVVKAMLARSLELDQDRFFFAKGTAYAGRRIVRNCCRSFAGSGREGRQYAVMTIPDAEWSI